MTTTAAPATPTTASGCRWPAVDWRSLEGCTCTCCPCGNCAHYLHCDLVHGRS